ncbi:MAG: hypothetical protein KAG61_03685, partial [Bacteriovoracaceae bacterium]|nr:hypothetical protein [Bacteriovoracaceae bacterium]
MYSKLESTFIERTTSLFDLLDYSELRLVTEDLYFAGPDFTEYLLTGKHPKDMTIYKRLKGEVFGKGCKTIKLLGEQVTFYTSVI